MFSFFKKDNSQNQVKETQQTPTNSNVISSATTKSNTHNHVEPIEIGDSDSNISEIELSVEMGGGKGWPTDVTCVLYHRVQGLICVGTAGGAIYVYGDGFQFMRPWLTNDPNEVSSIVALHHNRILVLFGDNSIVVMELPTLDIIDLLSPSWLANSGKNVGDISVIHVDAPGEKNFAYVGTSEGLVLVLDVMEASIRIVDFKLTCAELLGGGQPNMTVTDLQCSSKDDRYLAVGYGGSQGGVGAVVLFDLVKHKVHRLYKTGAVTSMDWDSNGENLYVGTRQGDLLDVSLERTSLLTVWNAAQESCDADEDEPDAEGNAAVVIRKVSWLAPQNSSPDGCLFVSLASRGSDDDSLKNVIVALAPLGIHGEMEIVFSLPPVPYERVVGFRVVPTYDKGEPDEQAGPVAVIPALLMLTERPDAADEDAAPTKHLKIVRCPSQPVSDWALEIGTTPDPRKATEVLPSAADIICIEGFVSTNAIRSLTAALLAQVADNGDKLVSTISAPAAYTDMSAVDMSGRTASRRLSTRDFLQANNLISDLEQQLGAAENWEMVLASGIQQQQVGGAPRVQDVVVKGHADGTVIAWGVSLPVSGKELGRGNVWQPLKAFRCGSSEVRVLAHDDRSGLLAAGDESGLVVIWEIYDARTGKGATDILQQLFEDADENSRTDEAALYSRYQPNDFREVLRVQLKDPVTSLLLLPDTLSLFVGTEDGSVHACSNFNPASGKTVVSVCKPTANHAPGSVLRFHFAQFSIFEAVVPAVYVYHSSGQLAVVELNTLSVLASYAAPVGFEESTVHVSQLVVLNSALAPLAPPTLHATTSAVSAAAAAAVSAFKSNTSSADVSDSSAPAKPARISMFASRTKPATPPPQHVTAPVTTAPSGGNDEVPENSATTPRFLMLVRDKVLLTYDLSRLSKQSPQMSTSAAGSIWRSSQPNPSSPVPSAGAVTSRVVAQFPLVASTLLQYTTNGEDSENVTTGFGCINSRGVFVLVSVRHRAPVSHFNLLEGVVDADSNEEAPTVSMGTVLSNGNCYFCSRSRSMVYSATTRSEAHTLLTCVLPDAASPQSSPPDKGLCLLTGREQQLANMKLTLKKRRSSVINMSAAPTDLYKVFAKSREQRGRDELLSEAHSSRDDDNTTKSTGRAATKAVSDLAQVRQNFEERGQKINQIALKMDDFKESAQQYRQTVTDQKNKLKQKNARWGLF